MLDRLVKTPGIVLAFLWGFAEGTLFFIVPDVLLSLAALLAPHRAWRHVVAAVAGALLAGALMYTFSTHSPGAAYTTVAHVPFVTPRMFDHVLAGYHNNPVAALCLGPLSGVPYKIYAVLAPGFLSLSTFLLASIPARGERFLLVWGIFSLLGMALRRGGITASKTLAIIHAAFWLIFYGFYWTLISIHR